MSSKSGARIVIILFLWMRVSIALAAQDSPFLLPDESTLSILLSGDPLVENLNSKLDGAAVSILIFVQAPVERIWEIIVSCDDAMVFVAGLKFCEVLEERGDYALTHQVVDKGWLTPKLSYSFATEREPYRHMEFRLTDGNLKTLEGSWDFHNLAEGVLVRHILVLQPKLPAPRWLVRRNIEKDFPAMMRCIRALAGGSGSEQAIREDKQHCPGKVQ